MNPYPWEQSDLGPYYLQYRLAKTISRQEVQTTSVVPGRLLHIFMCTSEVQTVRLDFFMESNNMNPNQTARLILVHIICNIG